MRSTKTRSLFQQWSKQGEDEVKKGPSKHKNAIVQEEYVIGQTKSVSKRQARAGSAHAGRAGTGSHLEKSDNKSSGKGKERGKITACYLDGKNQTMPLLKVSYRFLLQSELLTY